MKKSGSVLMMSVLFWIVSGSFALADEPCVMKARVTSIPPLFYQDNDDLWTGLIVELANVLLEEVGCQGEFQNIPWKRSLYEMKLGRLQMMMNLSKTEERQEYIHFIGPQIDETANLYLSEKIDIQSLDDLKDIPGKIGYQTGTFLGEDFAEKFESDPVFRQKFELVASSEFNLKKLAAGRISGFVGQSYGGVALNSEFFKKGGLSINPFVIHQDWVYFGFSKKAVSEEMLAKLEAGFQSALEKGRFQEVIEAYQ